MLGTRVGAAPRAAMAAGLRQSNGEPSMAWTKRTEHLDPIDQTHVVRLHDPERSDNPAHDHIIQVAIGMRGCPHCGRPYDAQGTAADPKAIASSVMHTLKRIGQRGVAYANRHGIPAKKR